jgi:hypothetical protein
VTSTAIGANTTAIEPNIKQNTKNDSIFRWDVYKIKENKKMLSNRPSFGFSTELKSTLFAIALGLLMCVNTFASNTLYGTVYNENSTSGVPGNYVEHAYVCAYGSPNVCAYTSTGGVYFLLNLGSGAYDVCVTKTAGEDVNGITHADALAVSAHVANTTPLANDFLKWAADASCNLSITSFDAGKIDAWPSGSYGCTGQWRFVPEGVSVPWPTSDASVCQHYDSISGEVGDQDFDGILKGEVTGDWVCPIC